MGSLAVFCVCWLATIPSVEKYWGEPIANWAFMAAPMMLSSGTVTAFSATRTVSASLPLFSLCVSACVSAFTRQMSATATLVACEGDGERCLFVVQYFVT